jgi:apolipoprotein N-acyltransferase
VIFAFAGTLLGLAFLCAKIQLLVWPGIAVLVFALDRERSRGRALVGIFATMVFKQALALHWLVLTGSHYLHWSLLRAVVVAALAWGLSAAIAAFPVAFGVLVFRRFPRRATLPLCWLLGEALVARATGFSMGHVLHSQWANPPVLRAVAYIGWSATLLLCLYASSCVGEALARRTWYGLLPPTLIVLVLLILPSIPVEQEQLDGVGAAYAAHATDLPESTPAGVELLVWPEESVRARPEANEGPLERPIALRSFDFHSAVEHVMGIALRLPEGGVMNAAAFVDAHGLMRATRGKSVLVPVGERRFLGIPALGGIGYTPGIAVPILATGHRRVIPLICYEVFDRDVSARGADAGGTLLAVLSSDRPLGGSEIALDQAIGALVLRAVELHLPAVRASVGGSAALVLPDGRIVARSVRDRSGVLVAPQDQEQ